MRKEVIFAILIGALFGVVIVVGIRRLNSAPPPETPPATPQQDEENEQIDPQQTAESIFITISDPQTKDVITENPAEITGLTLPEVWVALIIEDDELITRSDTNGEFSFEYDLSGGINLLELTAINSNGERATTDLNLVFTSQLE